MWSPPPSDKQVEFLRNIQRLLAEGQFTATYKFALLHALADLAILKGDDSGAPLTLNRTDIAEKFIELYWHQCRPFEIGGDRTGPTLQQNAGKQATVIRVIIESQEKYAGSLFDLKRDSCWKSLVAEVRSTVCAQPLWKLQTVGSDRLDFLYDNNGKGTTITLKPGVAYCLRAFYGLLRNQVQAEWIRKVQELNALHFGHITDLGTFLFGHERNVLEAYRGPLIEIQGGNCFYCGKPLSQQIDVDHFIPWSRYPTDLGHNFVLSHPQCNNSKSDYLGAEEHLTNWTERIRTQGDKLNALFEKAELPCDLSASIRIAHWAYEQTEKSQGQVWVEKKVLRHLGPDWRQLLVA